MAYVYSRVDTPFNEDDELAAIETFEDSVDTTKFLINRLMTTKRTLRTAIHLSNQTSKVWRT